MTDIYLKHLGTNTGFSGSIIDYGNDVYDFIGNGAEYRIDVRTGTNTYWGAIEIQDHENTPIVTGMRPGYWSGATPVALPPVALLSAGIVGDHLELNWRDNPIGAGNRNRNAKIYIEGKTLKINYSAVAPTNATNGNYAGLYNGDWNASLPSLEIVEMPGVMSTPTISYTTASGTTQFVGNMLDYTKSNASDYILSNPRNVTDSVKHLWSYSTVGKYLVDNNTKVMPFNETIFITNSPKISDCFVANNAEQSPHFDTLIKSPYIFLVLGGITDNWTHYYNYIDKIGNEWGLDNAFINFNQMWTDISYTNTYQSNGMDWYPAGGDTGGTHNFVDVASLITGLGYYCCPYSFWGHSREGSPSYTTGHIALGETGDFLQNVFHSTGIGSGNYITKEEYITGYLDGIYVTGQGAANGEDYGGLKEMITGYGVNSVYYDVSHYGAPNRGNGFSCERQSGSPTRTLSGLINERHIWSLSGVAMVDGPAGAEGSRVEYLADCEYLWSNVAAAHQGQVNTNAGTDELDVTEGSRRSISDYIIVPEYEWKVRNKIGVKLKNAPQRFFALYEKDTLITDSEQPTQTTLYPYNRAMNDRIRCYDLLYGRAGGTYVNGLPGQWSGQDYAYYMHKKEHLKEFYLMNPITRACRDGEEPEITYIQSNEIGEETFEELYDRLGLVTGFTRIKVHIKFNNKFDVFVNRSNTDWVDPVEIGMRITIPTDGYFAVGIVDGKQYMGGSVITSLSQGKRVDFAYIPGEYVLADGRDELNNFMGLTLTNGKLVFKHMRKNFTLTEDSGEDIIRTEGV